VRLGRGGSAREVLLQLEGKVTFPEQMRAKMVRLLKRRLLVVENMA
jgi:hypothetical protein